MRTIMNMLMALVMLAGLVLAAPAQAFAQDITVQVRSISASQEGTKFDPKLEDLRKKLGKAFKGYTNFELVGDNTFKVALDETKTTSLPNGDTISVSFHGMAGKFIRLGLGIAGKLNTTLRASSGSTFFQAGLEYQSGILILAITIQ
ncbi:MAG: hypothetical protein R3E66_02505 [bacterium]